MKRYVAIATGLAALGLLAYLGNTYFVHAQGQGAGATRVATVNMYVIMKGYKKVEIYKDEIKKIAAPYDADLKKLQKSYEDWTNYSKNPKISAADKDKASKVLLDLKRQVEDKRMEAQKIIVKRGEEQITQLYREIEDAIERYSKSNGIHVVFQYLEPIGQEYTSRNIDRKLNACGNAGACCPVYMAPGIDISQQVLQVLNSSLGTSGVVPTGG